MPFYFSCPYCLNKTLVSEELSGQTGACVSCGKSITVPAPPAARRLDIAPAGMSSQSAVVEVPRKGRVPRWLIRGAIYTALAIPVLIVAASYLRPMIMQLKSQRDIIMCQQNLKRIGKALNSYAAEYGTYPPAITNGPDGKPWHSWRVLILPYLGEKALYDKYDMNKPWNAAENTPIQAMMPSVYASPGNTNLAAGESSYMVITGTGTLFPDGSPPLSPNSIVDGASDTILVVETNTRVTSWIEPVDLRISKLPPRIGQLDGVGGTHLEGATVVFADGRTVLLPGDTSAQVMKGLITPAGSEAVSGDWYK